MRVLSLFSAPKSWAESGSEQESSSCPESPLSLLSGTTASSSDPEAGSTWMSGISGTEAAPASSSSSSPSDGGATMGIALEGLLGSMRCLHQLLNPLPLSGPLGILMTFGGSLSPAAALSRPAKLLLKAETLREGRPRLYWAPSAA